MDVCVLCLFLVVPWVSLQCMIVAFSITVEPVLSDHSKIDKANILMVNGSLMKVESIAECSPRSILQYF